MNEIDSEIIYAIETYPLNHPRKITYSELLSEVDYEMALITKIAFLQKIERLLKFGAIWMTEEGLLGIDEKEKLLADKLSKIDTGKR